MSIKSFHDWVIHSIAAPIPGKVDVDLVSEVGTTRKRLSFMGVTRVRVDGFSTQNIVYEAKILDPDSAQFADAVLLLDQTDSPRPSEMRHIVQFSPSVGASILIEFEASSESDHAMSR